MPVDAVHTIKDGVVECSVVERNADATLSLHYHAGGDRNYITEWASGGVWSEIPANRIFERLRQGLVDRDRVATINKVLRRG